MTDNKLKEVREETEYVPSKETLELFQKYCNIDDKEVVKARAKKAHEECTKIHPYRCISEYRFMEARSKLHPFYSKLVDIAKQNEKQTLHILDIGCCMGTDIRQMIIDKIVSPTKNNNSIIGIELEENFIQAGYQLFGDAQKMKENNIMHIFDIFSLLSDDNKTESSSSKIIQKNKFDIIYCGSVYHLLDEQHCQSLSKIIYSLLSPKGILFGRTGGIPSEKLKEISKEKKELSGPWKSRFLYSECSLKTLFETSGFVDVEVVVGPVDLPPLKNDDGGHAGARKVLSFTAHKQ